MSAEEDMAFQPGVYRHFKGRLYEAYGVATHSETGETLVVYRALYGEHRLYVRPLAMFCEEIDRTLHPEATQRMRFKLIKPAVDVSKHD